MLQKVIHLNTVFLEVDVYGIYHNVPLSKDSKLLKNWDLRDKFHRTKQKSFSSLKEKESAKIQMYHYISFHFSGVSSWV